MGNAQGGLGVSKSPKKLKAKLTRKEEKQASKSPPKEGKVKSGKTTEKKVLDTNSSGLTSDAKTSSSSGSENNDTLADLVNVDKEENKSPKLSRIIRKPTQILAEMPIFPGRRSRRNSEDDGPVRILSRMPPSVPAEERFDAEELESAVLSSSPAPPRRPRALTISNGQAARARLYFKRLMDETSKKQRQHAVPTVIRVSENALRSASKEEEPKVYVAGSMTQWRCVQMLRPKGERDYLIIVNCQVGRNLFRFNVNNVWMHDPEQESVARNVNENKRWNVVNVSRSDHDVFDALAFDSFLIKGSDSDNEANDRNIWTQDFPGSTLSSSTKGPPILPPQLLQDVLSRPMDSRDPVLLKEPSHVTLNHLYAQSIRENVMVVRSTIRFRRKCVTLMYYKNLGAPQQ